MNIPDGCTVRRFKITADYDAKGNCIIPFRRDHLDLIELQPHEKALLDFDGYVASLVAKGAVVHTYIYRGIVLCIYGYFMLWPGVLEIFITPSIYFPKYPKKVMELAKMEFGKVLDLPGIHRIQSFSYDEPIRSKFMLHFGFEPEGVLRKYTSSGQDYRMWSYIREVREWAS